MKTVNVLAEYWPVITSIIVLGYFVVKLAIRNAVLEIINEIQKDFCTKVECHECRETLNKRIDKLQGEFDNHRERRTTDTQKLRKIVKELKVSEDTQALKKLVKEIKGESI
jgi:ABC-type microcin C transport system permease subunit YejB